MTVAGIDVTETNCPIPHCHCGRQSFGSSESDSGSGSSSSSSFFSSGDACFSASLGFGGSDVGRRCFGTLWGRCRAGDKELGAAPSEGLREYPVVVVYRDPFVSAFPGPSRQLLIAATIKPRGGKMRGPP